MAISMDGSLVASGGVDITTLYVYDMVNHSLKWEIDEKNRSVTKYTALSFSEDGSLLAGGGIEQDIFVWDMDTGQLVNSLYVPYLQVLAVYISPDNQYLTGLTTNIDFIGVTIWDLNTGQSIRTLTLENTQDADISDLSYQLPHYPTHWVAGDLAFLPGHDNLLAFSMLQNPEENDGPFWAVYYWDINGDQLRGIIPGIAGHPMAKSPDGKFLAVEVDGQLLIWDIENAVVVWETAHSDQEHNAFERLTISNNGYVAYKNGSGDITIFDQEGNLLGTIKTGLRFAELAFTPTDNLLVTSRVANGVEVWEIGE